MLQLALYLLCTFAQEDIMADPFDPSNNPNLQRRVYFVRMDGFVPARVRPQHRNHPKPEKLELHFADLPIRGCFFKVTFDVRTPPLGRVIDPR